MNRITNCLFQLLWGATILVSCGCLSRVAETNGYSSGSYKTVLTNDMNDLSKATVQALEDLNIPVQTQFNGEFIGVINALTAGDVDVTIELNRLTEGSTQITIRVGRFGDRQRTMKIFRRIRDLLETATR